MKHSREPFGGEPRVMFQTWCLTFRASHLVSLCFCLSICKTRTSIFTYPAGFCGTQPAARFHSVTANSEGKAFLRDAGTRQSFTHHLCVQNTPRVQNSGPISPYRALRDPPFPASKLSRSSSRSRRTNAAASACGCIARADPVAALTNWSAPLKPSLYHPGAVCLELGRGSRRPFLVLRGHRALHDTANTPCPAAGRQAARRAVSKPRSHTLSPLITSLGASPRRGHSSPNRSTLPPRAPLHSHSDGSLPPSALQPGAALPWPPPDAPFLRRPLPGSTAAAGPLVGRGRPGPAPPSGRERRAAVPGPAPRGWRGGGGGPGAPGGAEPLPGSRVEQRRLRAAAALRLSAARSFRSGGLVPSRPVPSRRSPWAASRSTSAAASVAAARPRSLSYSRSRCRRGTGSPGPARGAALGPV